MANYYFLAIRLPDIRLEMPLDINFQELETLLADNLKSSDLNKIKVIRRLYDILNIRNFWLKRDLDRHGNFDENQLEEALLMRKGFPDYVYAFIEHYENVKERIEHFPDLIHLYFKKEIDLADGFLKRYLELERGIRLILTAFRAKKTGREVIVELQNENPEEDIIAQIIAQKDAKSYEPPEPYQDLKKIFEEFQDNPIGLQRALIEYRIEKVENYLGVDPFSINHIIAYFIEFILIENWAELDQTKGIEIVDNIVKEAS